MPKGGGQRFSDGRRRAGIGKIPEEIERKLRAWLADPTLIDQLPEARRAIARQQVAGYQALLERRRASALAGHATRAARRAAAGRKA